MACQDWSDLLFLRQVGNSCSFANSEAVFPRAAAFSVGTVGKSITRFHQVISTEAALHNHNTIDERGDFASREWSIRSDLIKLFHAAEN